MNSRLTIKDGELVFKNSLVPLKKIITSLAETYSFKDTWAEFPMLTREDMQIAYTWRGATNAR